MLKCLQQGLYLVKGAFNLKEQQSLLNFVTSIDNKFSKGKDLHRGRYFDDVEKFPTLLINKCMSTLHTISGEQSHQFTHCIALKYNSTNGNIKWHQDKDANDGINEMCVMSVSIGDTCEFLVCNEKPKITNLNYQYPTNLAHRITLESGDILIFGNKSRYIHHAIYKILPNTSMLNIQDTRYNFTLRCAPNIVGNKHKFQEQFKSVYN